MRRVTLHRMNLRRGLFLSALLLGLPLGGLTLGGCGGDNNTYEIPPAPAPRATTPRRERSGSDAGVQSRVAALVEANERTLPNADMRDPFTPPPPAQGPTRSTGVQVAPDCDTDQHPLGKISIDNLYLMGLITGTSVPRAMFTTPISAQGTIVTEGALVGPDCAHRLVDIRDNEVVFEQVTMNEAERARTTIKLREQRIPQQFLEIEEEDEAE